MASYFDEHDCEPLGEGQSPDHYLHLARLLRDGGFLEEFQELFGQIEASPPASKEVVQNLPVCSVSYPALFILSFNRLELMVSSRVKLKAFFLHHHLLRP